MRSTRAFYGTHLFYHGEKARDRFAHQSKRSVEEEWRYRDARNEKVAAHFQTEPAAREDQTSERAGASRLGRGKSHQGRFGGEGCFVDRYTRCRVGTRGSFSFTVFKAPPAKLCVYCIRFLF